MKLLISITLAMISIVSQAYSQIVVSAKMNKKQLIAYEDVNISLTITNRAGQQIDFVNKFDSKWVEFIVERRGGETVFAQQNTVYAPMRLPTGETRTSSFRLNSSYDLSAPGNYTAYAVVRMPGQSVAQGTKSGKVHFNIIRGVPSWKQRAGVPGTPGDTREYRLINVLSERFTELYVQVEDVKRAKMLATYSLGRNLEFRDYKATLDSSNRLNVLFQTTPEIYSHTIVEPSGKLIRRAYHKKGPGGTAPKLITTQSGVVGVAGSTPYDPEKENDLRSKIHNLSELPLGL